MSKFSPIDIHDAHILRRLVFLIEPFLGYITRIIWITSKSSQSSCHEQTRLWQFIWIFHRKLYCLPRLQSSCLCAQVAPGIRMSLDLSRLTDAFVFCFGIGESEIGYLASVFLQPNSIILDIGSNIGSTALAFAARVPDGKVYAFEPSSKMCDILKNNISLNKFTNVTILPYGLSDTPAHGYLKLSMPGNPGSAYFKSKQGQEDDAPAKLRVLDKVFQQNKTIDFIKIDVEGFEYRVLKGGE